MEERSELTSAETIAIPAISSGSGRQYADEGRFIPGTLLGGRYRVIGLLGKGGMGEVYRATDLTLGQSVALKFLPESAAASERLLERFQGEVRVARQVSHPNVCRVYDIGEVEGLPFISMEYVDGEDLASLLQRIGRLPADKAVQVARKICAGLAAAHDKGVIHRDLKPHNIMMNKRGEVLIMDFGLAAIADQISGQEARHGTPAYMAPEQLKGTEVSIRSDIYSLGLVLYELFTGRRPYEAASIPHLLDLQESAQLTSMSSIAADIDPAVEKAIRRCLDPDPGKRPAGALSVSAALPGGDPLAAALAAGETPSPDLVAAAGKTEGLSRRLAVTCLAAVLICLAAAPFLRQRRLAIHRTPLEYPPAVLQAKAREIAVKFGYTAKPKDSVLWLAPRRNLIQHMNLVARSHGSRWDEWLAAEAPFSAFYRESPKFLFALPHGTVTSDNPAPIVPGMVEVELDGAGRLRNFSAIPTVPDGQPATASHDAHIGHASSSGPPVKEAHSKSAPVEGVFRAAQLDLAKFTEVAPRNPPVSPADDFRAWKGPHPTIPDTEIQVEIGSWKGTLTSARFLWHWDLPEGTAHATPRWALAVRDYLLPAVVVIGTLVALLLARRNWATGRVDRRGALRLAGTQFVLIVLFWIGWPHLTPDNSLLELAIQGVRVALLQGAITWLLYLSLEPALRSRWPQSIVTWNRVLKGQWSDAQVWAHILIGAASGLLTIVVVSLREISALSTEGLGFSGSLGMLLGARQWAGLTVLRFSEALQSGLLIFFVIFGLRLLLRKDWIAALASASLMAALEGNLRTAPDAVMAFLVYVCAYSVMNWILLRLGLVVMISSIFFINSFGNLAFGTDLTTWYAPYGLATLALMLGIAVFAFWKSLGNRELFGTPEQAV
jgi:predicted Ser/Thr protein kinase